MRGVSFVLAFAALAAAQYQPDPSLPWMDPKDSPTKRAQILLNAMNLTEKVFMMHGTNSEHEYVGEVPGTARLNLPSLNLNDGPQGFRDNAHPGSTTAWPSGMTVGTTFDRQAALEWGAAMGEEFIGKGANVQLGPGVCLARVPQCGRLFEYISGEDPWLGHEMVQPAVQGIQSQGVIANAKHFILNNQETNRNTQTAIIDERTFFEMYMPPFAGASQAEVGSIMCSYNKINNTWSCENAVTLAKDYKQLVGFEGWVMSDWGATHSASILAGLDQEMPGDGYMGLDKDLGKLIQDGNVTEADLNNTVMRMLVPMFKFGVFDRPQTNTTANNVTSPAHNALARKLAAASTVLLKNDGGILPLNLAGSGSPSKPFTVAIIGAQAKDPIVHGGGSGQVVPYYTSAPLDAIMAEMGIAKPAPPKNNCSQANWDVGTDFRNTDSQTSASSSDIAACCELCASRSTPCKAFSFTDGTCWMKADAANPLHDASVTSGIVLADPVPTRSCSSDGSRCVVYDDGSNLTSASDVARSADVALVFAATTSHEGADRTSLDLDGNANDLIPAVGSAQPKTVVACVNPGPITTEWRTSVAGIITNHMPGQEYGHALVDVLVGRVNPSARLSITYPAANQSLLGPDQWPGVNKETSYYTEKLNVGYRGFMSKGWTPAFAFGHGLSYTTFAYSNLAIDASARTVNVDVKNSGSVDGSEIVQLYLGFPGEAGEPPLQLKRFEKVDLSAGASTTVKFTLDERAFSTWDVDSHAWKVEHGTFGVSVGASVLDIRVKGTIAV